ncbi:hypothetical protein MUP00_09335, partial [Candidatus Bathyarchaeota archaeon]|nr:hypothetical protein [Candidatus Bathyarchaeota archaeon]
MTSSKDSDRIRRIREHLQKGEFATEIKASRILNERHWSVYPQFPFLDPSEDKLRSVDMKATFTPSGDFQSISGLDPSCELYIECKKPSSVEECWVFYVESHFEPELRLFAKRLSIGLTGKKLDGLLRISNSHRYMPSLKAYSYRIAFKGNNKDKFNEAMYQALKSIEYSPTVTPIDIIIHQTFPVILYEGEMYACDSANLEPAPIDHVTYLSSGIPENPILTYVDVVRMDYFPTYLKLIEKEVNEAK